MTYRRPALLLALLLAPACAPRSPAPAATADAPAVVVPLPEYDPQSLAAPIRGALPQLRTCYERQVARNPLLEGMLTVQFRIDADGRVGRADIQMSTLEGMGKDEAEACITRRFQQLEFPPPEPPRKHVVVNYPLSFRATADYDSLPPGLGEGPAPVAARSGTRTLQRGDRVRLFLVNGAQVVGVVGSVGEAGVVVAPAEPGRWQFVKTRNIEAILDWK